MAANYQPLLVHAPIPPPVAPQVTAPSGQPQVIVLNTGPQAQGNVPGGNVSAAGNQRFNVRAGRITGGIQIMCAILSAICGIVAILAALCVVAKDQCRYNNNYDYIYIDFFAYLAWPIWGAVCFYVVAGILGVSTGSKNTCVIVAYMVMSIIAALSSAGQVIMESIGAAVSLVHCSSTRIQDSYGLYHYEYVCHYRTFSTVIHSLAAVLALIEMIVAIVAAAYCCHGVCCRTAPQQVMVQLTTPAPQFQTVTPPSAPPQYHDAVY